MKRTPVILFSSFALFAPLAACERQPASTSTNNSSSTGATTPSTDRSTTTTTTPTRTDTPRAPDNTGNNRADRSGDTVTPPNQSEAAADIRITADIRRAIMDDATLSTNAKNIKIMTDKAGVVTLRGVVDSQAEKDAIDAKAKAVVGVTSVSNQLEIQPR
ncbi:MAG: BON domain-containing protein [Phycisphaerae bacterium]|jgi:hyperosmotically inducible protein